MAIKIFGDTHIGMKRKTNQDAFAYEVLSDDLAFAVVCDGMGGERGGNVASRTATDRIGEALSRDLREGLSPMTIKNIMDSAVISANATVYNLAQADPNLTGMGTTVIAAVLSHNTVYISHAGDSRVYLIREKGEQITKDHTMVQMLVDNGELSSEDARRHPKRHYITRALGIDPVLELDFYEQPLEAGDLLLLCSDGLYNYLQYDDLEILTRRSAGLKTAAPLIDRANQLGGADNITAVIIAR